MVSLVCEASVFIKLQAVLKEEGLAGAGPLWKCPGVNQLCDQRPCLLIEMSGWCIAAKHQGRAVREHAHLALQSVTLCSMSLKSCRDPRSWPPFFLRPACWGLARAEPGLSGTVLTFLWSDVISLLLQFPSGAASGMYPHWLGCFSCVLCFALKDFRQFRMHWSWSLRCRGERCVQCSFVMVILCPHI